ncbi:hypothetical protein D9C73_015003 [Collichthys lucidus]|uniref:Uncharacterized protein n=1 Tax=Collichthys lucidus TaxID=240159 RepID=A0A4U5V062_COLLU|nr:hypothetical protein D9C73_015003 [Collichthys lucidus]
MTSYPRRGRLRLYLSKPSKEQTCRIGAGGEAAFENLHLCPAECLLPRVQSLTTRHVASSQPVRASLRCVSASGPRSLLLLLLLQEEVGHVSNLRKRRWNRTPEESPCRESIVNVHKKICEVGPPVDTLND